MDEGTVLGLLIKKLNDDIAGLSDALCQGRCADYAAYTRMCGQLQGVYSARLHIEEMVKRLREQDE